MSTGTGQTVTAASEAQCSSPTVAFETVVHELRQPLSAIESIAYYLNLVLPREIVVARAQAARLQHLVEQSNWILTSALQLADRRPFNPQPVDLEELITQTISSRPWHSNCSVLVELRGGLPLVSLDLVRGRALLENLFLLFRQFGSELHPVRLTTSAFEGRVCLSMATSAPGYRSEACLGPGCGLGIETARRVVEGHGGTLGLDVDMTRGINLQVVLP